MRRPQRGFTLIEIVIAVMITAILFTMAYGAIQQALANRERLQENSERLQKLQFTMRSLVQDFTQLAPRMARDPLGQGHLPAIASAANSASVTLTRGGWMNPLGAERSTLQRVRYRLEDGKLLREYWLVLDPAIDPAPIRRELIDGVRGFSLRFYNDGKNWQDSWPPPSLTAAPSEMHLQWRPAAVEIVLDLEDWGRITRMVEVPG